MLIVPPAPDLPPSGFGIVGDGLSPPAPPPLPPFSGLSHYLRERYVSAGGSPLAVFHGRSAEIPPPLFTMIAANRALPFFPPPGITPRSPPCSMPDLPGLLTDFPCWGSRCFPFLTTGSGRDVGRNSPILPSCSHLQAAHFFLRVHCQGCYSGEWLLPFNGTPDGRSYCMSGGIVQPDLPQKTFWPGHITGVCFFSPPINTR